MENILRTVGKKRNCPSCSYVLKYSWLSRVNKNWISLYSNSGDTVLVSQELAKFAINEDQLADSIMDYEKEYGTGKWHGFSIRNEMRCPNCNQTLTTRSTAAFEELIGERVVFLDGMTFVNDEETYTVQIDAPPIQE